MAEKSNFLSNRVFGVLLLFVFVVGVAGGIIGSYAYFSYQNRVGTLHSNGTTNLTVTENSAVISAVKKISPAVVSITGTARTFNFFGSSSSAETAGTGFIVSKDGLILTNNHVVDNSNQTYTIYTADGKQYSGKVQQSDANSDLALVKINAKNLPTVTLGDSKNLQVGQTVIAIGNALGQYDNTVTTGIISGIGRSIQAGDTRGSGVETLSNVIQTDAVINQGNSGGPLINIDGQVIGINTATDAQGQAISFAIPINTAKSFLSHGFF